MRSIEAVSRENVEILIYDNGSSECVESFLKKNNVFNFSYFKREDNNFQDAFLGVINSCKNEWLMIFHDDDILNVRYINDFLKVLKKSDINHVNLVLSRCEFARNPDLNFSSTPLKLAYKKLNEIELATEIMRGEPIPFCSAIYRVSALKKINLEYHKYGKYFDRPLLFKVIKSANCILFNEKFIKYRVHDNQDSKAIDNPEAIKSQLLELCKFYYKYTEFNFKAYDRLYRRKLFSSLLEIYKKGNSKIFFNPANLDRFLLYLCENKSKTYPNYVYLLKSFFAYLFLIYPYSYKRFIKIFLKNINANKS